ncbi:hypothetical protein [Peristeroidobacter soli]|uniref:hypothetical protein n=1 Tax=Peristeroidobacter soli TaxID=2497877 RepID=UPI00101D995D|nr:hypothetical protein [Peristeroidobacter soli]
MNHTFIERMFLRDCAFLMRIGHREGDGLWHFGALATSITLSSLAFFAFAVNCVVFKEAIPREINLLAASREVLLVEIFVLVFGIRAWVNYRLRCFKGNMRSVRQYQRGMDLFWWLMATVVAVAAAVGSGVVLFIAHQSGAGQLL